uniref:Small ribosomal subunit protein uS8 n=1 Tax=Candidatus Aschnera chinzeii TaxID=1485666 RepID=A0AAT9G468_9ENTR|nr:MAG: 30S ribosomal protein S8 [Candidatus Aschnera chinzeii]
MNIQDPISDMITRIRNAHNAYKTIVVMPSSKIKSSISDVLKREGYILDYSIDTTNNKKPILKIILKYFHNKAVISHIQRVSKPSVRVYKKKDKIPKIMAGLGISIISTSKGIMSNNAAYNAGLGGEILCYVS